MVVYSLSKFFVIIFFLLKFSDTGHHYLLFHNLIGYSQKWFLE